MSTLEHKRPMPGYDNYGDTETAHMLYRLMREHYGKENLRIAPAELEKQIETFELFGHNHDFGAFEVSGHMQDRHILIPATIQELFGTFPLDLDGKKVLDVGCWSGGLSMLLRALGAEVHAVDEVWENLAQLVLVKSAYCLDRIAIVHKSVTDLGPAFYGLYDYTFCFGVIYHVSDIIGALRQLAATLKDGGTLFVESMATGLSGTQIEYRGGETGRIGPNWWIPSTEALQRMIEDTGLTVVNRSYHLGGRCIIEARK